MRFLGGAQNTYNITPIPESDKDIKALVMVYFIVPACIVLWLQSLEPSMHGLVKDTEYSQ